jgi:hypothetical protein
MFIRVVRHVQDTRLIERLTWQFRLEISNPFNRVVLGAPSTDLNAANFGLIGGQSSPRVISSAWLIYDLTGR